MKKLKLAVSLLAAAILAGNSAAAQISTISVESISPAVRKVKFANAPLNLIVPETLSALNQAVQRLSEDEQVKVVIFTSDVDGYFFNHFDMAEFPNFLKQTGSDARPLWVELISNLANAPFVSIASIHGRTQGGGDELALAMDLRYASKEKAVFNQPEVGIGLFPGGGATGHLARLAGRDRAIEALLSSDDYSAEMAERYGWITRAIPEAQLDGYVDQLAHRLATFDRTALTTTRRHINAVAAPGESERLATYAEFAKSLAWPGLRQRMPVFAKIIERDGPAKVEGKLGHYILEGNQQLQGARK